MSLCSGSLVAVLGYVVLSFGFQTQMGMRGYVKEGLELAPTGSFDIEQGGCQLRT